MCLGIVSNFLIKGKPGKTAFFGSHILRRFLALTSKMEVGGCLIDNRQHLSNSKLVSKHVKKSKRGKILYIRARRAWAKATQIPSKLKD